MNTTLELVQAEQALEDARSRIAAEQRDRDIHTLAALRTELREAKARYDVIATEHLQATEARASLTRQIDEVRFLVDQSQDRMPAVADVLADDPEVVAWRTKHSMLEAERDEYVAQRSAIPFVNRVEGVQLAQSIQQLGWSIQNMLNKLNNKSGTFLDGGVSFVA